MLPDLIREKEYLDWDPFRNFVFFNGAPGRESPSAPLFRVVGAKRMCSTILFTTITCLRGIIITTRKKVGQTKMTTTVMTTPGKTMRIIEKVAKKAMNELLSR